MTKSLEDHVAELQEVIDGPHGKLWYHTPAVSALIAALEHAQQELIRPLAIGELIQRLENQTGEPWGKRYLDGLDMPVKSPTVFADWILVRELLPEELEKSYQVVAISTKVHKGGNYDGQYVKAITQDWVVRKWPQNFTHWMPFPDLIITGGVK